MEVAALEHGRLMTVSLQFAADEVVQALARLQRCIDERVAAMGRTPDEQDKEIAASMETIRAAHAKLTAPL